MTAYSDEVRDLVLGTLWSMWVELGLSGWERRHQDTAIDLEALILTSARLGHRDTRLRDEALDWCVRYGRIASAVRLKHLASEADGAVRNAFGAFAATVNSQRHSNWPHATSPLAFKPTGRSLPPAFQRPALLQLRLRALWGVSARAEVLRVMLLEAHRFMGISEVAALAAFGKDAVATAMDSLTDGGMLDAAGKKNQRVYRLRSKDELIAVVGATPKPVSCRPWQQVLPIMAGILEATDVSEVPPMARAADIQRRWRMWQPELSRLGLMTHLGAGDEFLRDYEDFTLRALRTWSGGAA